MMEIQPQNEMRTGYKYNADSWTVVLELGRVIANDLELPFQIVYCLHGKEFFTQETER
jgi:hypothetical protein